MNFIALDVETANSDMSSICALGLVHFREGQIHKNLSTLIDPECRFDAINMSIHGITPEMVAGKPKMSFLYPIMQANFRDVVLVHHTHFDRVAFQKVAQRLALPPIECRWLDSARVTRRAWPDCAKSGYGLDAMAGRLGIKFEHHQAEEDARCAGLILLNAIQRTGISLEDWFKRVDAPLSQEKLARVGNPEGPMFGEVLAFTGALTIDRNMAAELAARAGCQVGSGVTKNTTILVIGEQPEAVLKGQENSAKLRKAADLIRQGASLRIIGESDFRAMVNY